MRALAFLGRTALCALAVTAVPFIILGAIVQAVWSAASEPS